jgi:hypothetical protein
MKRISLEAREIDDCAEQTVCNCLVSPKLVLVEGVLVLTRLVVSSRLSNEPLTPLDFVEEFRHTKINMCHILWHMLRIHQLPTS